MALGQEESKEPGRSNDLILVFWTLKPLVEVVDDMAEESAAVHVCDADIRDALRRLRPSLRTLGPICRSPDLARATLILEPRCSRDHVRHADEGDRRGESSNAR